MMELKELINLGDLHCTGIRRRAEQTSKSRYTRHYLLIDKGKEVAFMSIDLLPKADYLVLYELFVPTELRGTGIGSQVLALVDALARTLGLTRIVLNPMPFEGHFSQERLRNWYKKPGYKESSASTGELEKTLPI
jgi:GNAT superfamily N-acetyltransferase